MAYIYVITNDINDKKYVGQTTRSIEERFKAHLRDSKTKRGQKRPICQAINQYGIAHFKIELLEECSDEEGFAREVYWIDQLGTYDNGYNVTVGGAGRQTWDYKEIADLYIKLECIKAVTDFVGCERKVVRAACKRHNVKIKTPTDVTVGCNGKKVTMLDKTTREELMVFKSCGEAARYIISTSLPEHKVDSLACHIADAARGKRKSAYGYSWKYLE